MLDWEDDGDTNVSGKDAPKPRSGDRDRPYLIVLAGSNVGEMFKIGKAEVFLGRGAQNDIQILDDGVSRKHAVIRADRDETIVEDVGSKNGTFVNGEKVTRHALHDGDKIQMGATTILKFTYHDDIDESFQRQMYDSALRDGLTQIFNKRYFLERVEGEFRFAKRHGAALSVLLFDIDHFKRINDAHGHIAGDYVLVALARRVLDTIRKEDVFARYGGEEFAVLCRAIDPISAAAFAERVRKCVETFDFSFDSAHIPVTVSVGVAGLPHVEAEEPLALISAADEALYSAKHAGRNRVCLAGLPGAEIEDTGPDGEENTKEH